MARTPGATQRIILEGRWDPQRDLRKRVLAGVRVARWIAAVILQRPAQDAFLSEVSVLSSVLFYPKVGGDGLKSFAIGLRRVSFGHNSIIYRNGRTLTVCCPGRRLGRT